MKEILTLKLKNEGNLDFALEAIGIFYFEDYLSVHTCKIPKISGKFRKIPKNFEKFRLKSEYLITKNSD